MSILPYIAVASCFLLVITFAMLPHIEDIINYREKRKNKNKNPTVSK